MKSLGSVSERRPPLGGGAHDRGYEGGVNERAGAFEEARGTSGDGVDRGNDEPLAVDMIDEEKHPGAERFKRRHGRNEALFGCSKLSTSLRYTASMRSSRVGKWR
jgi:hypothetical protein